MTSLRGIAWCVLSDFGLQLCLLFFLALCAEQQRQQRLAAPELAMTLPGLAGRTVKAERERPPFVIEWDGARIAAGGRVLGRSDDPGVFAAVEDALRAAGGGPVLLRIPAGPYTRLRGAIGARDVRLEVAGR